MSTYRQNDDGSWSPAEPIGWLEEHGPIARLILLIRGRGHCGKRGWRKKHEGGVSDGR